jgi:thiamine kinase-like enzyme
MEKNKIIIEDNCIRKKCYTPWIFKEYNTYRQFSHDKDYLPKAISWISNHEYTMEKIEILCTIGDGLQNPTKYKLNKKAITKIPIVFNKIFSDCLDFSNEHLEENRYFMHRDLHIENLIMTPDHKIMLIDIDAFETTHKMVPYKWLNNMFTVLWMTKEALESV